MKQRDFYGEIKRREYEFTLSDVKELCRKATKTVVPPAGFTVKTEIVFDQDGVDLEGEPLIVVVETFTKLVAESLDPAKTQAAVSS